MVIHSPGICLDSRCFVCRMRGIARADSDGFARLQCADCGSCEFRDGVHICSDGIERRASELTMSEIRRVNNGNEA
jgi:hypothetical protein